MWSTRRVAGEPAHLRSEPTTARAVGVGQVARPDPPTSRTVDMAHPYSGDMTSMGESSADQRTDGTARTRAGRHAADRQPSAGNAGGADDRSARHAAKEGSPSIAPIAALSGGRHRRPEGTA